MKQILVVQTAFIGDVILSTSVVEAIRSSNPDIKIDFLLRKGNESLLNEHPHINKILIWDKQGKKYKSLLHILKQIRKTKYDALINIQRFGATGLLTALSRAKIKIGFTNNPFSFAFTHKIDHHVNKGLHEIQRNLLLLKPIMDVKEVNPRLYPLEKDFELVKKYQDESYICVAPTSVWFTKQYPVNKWVEFFNKIPAGIKIYLLGAPSDHNDCQDIINKSTNTNLINLAGKLNMLASAALMKTATMNFVNDSAPMHMASSVNAPTTAVFCSTIPAFGFGPLSENSLVVESKDKLECRPCGLHGKKKCPEGHFNCANTINVSDLINRIKI